MRTLTAVVLTSAITLSIASADARNATTINEMHQGGFLTGSMTQNPQSHMFDGIELTEQQRQQMRDLMQQTRHEPPVVHVDDIAALHELVTASQFNEAAIRNRAEIIARVQVEQQVEMARVQNQMFQLLTPAQQATLQKNYQQRINELRQISALQPASSLQAVSTTSSNQ